MNNLFCLLGFHDWPSLHVKERREKPTLDIFGFKPTFYYRTYKCRNCPKTKEIRYNESKYGT